MSKIATRGRILDAALDEFARQGYHRATVDDIVRTSGTSKGAVYHHFPSKEAMFAALVDAFAARLATGVGAAIGGRQGALRRVEGALEAALGAFAENERVARLILLEATALGSAWQAKRLEVHDRFVALIQGHLDEAVAEGAIPPQDTRLATLAWLGALNEIVLRWLLAGTPPILDTVPELTRLLLRSIGARVPA